MSGIEWTGKVRRVESDFFKEAHLHQKDTHRFTSGLFHIQLCYAMLG